MSRIAEAMEELAAALMEAFRPVMQEIYEGLSEVLASLAGWIGTVDPKRLGIEDCGITEVDIKSVDYVNRVVWTYSRRWIEVDTGITGWGKSSFQEHLRSKPNPINKGANDG